MTPSCSDVCARDRLMLAGVTAMETSEAGTGTTTETDGLLLPASSMATSVSVSPPAASTCAVKAPAAEATTVAANCVV